MTYTVAARTANPIQNVEIHVTVCVLGSGGPRMRWPGLRTSSGTRWSWFPVTRAIRGPHPTNLQTRIFTCWAVTTSCVQGRATTPALRTGKAIDLSRIDVGLRCLGIWLGRSPGRENRPAQRPGRTAGRGRGLEPVTISLWPVVVCSSGRRCDVECWEGSADERDT